MEKPLTVVGEKKEIDPREVMFTELSLRERPQNESVLKAINLANRVTNQLLGEYGKDPVNVRSDIFHVIRSDAWIGQDNHALFSREHDTILIKETLDQDSLILGLMHEMLHYKGENFLPNPLTEAIVERLAAQAVNIERMRLGAEPMQGESIFSGTYTYNRDRIVLDGLLGKLRDESEGKIKDRPQAFSYFAKAHLNGVIEYLKILDEIFGAGTVEKLDKLDDNPESFKDFVDSL